MDVRTRRQALENSLTGGLLVATAYEAVQLSGDMAVPFLQEANFLWLTNLPFAGWKVIIDSARQHVVLVRPARSHTQELFDGKVDEASLVARAAGNEVIDEREFEGSTGTTASAGLHAISQGDSRICGKSRARRTPRAINTRLYYGIRLHEAVG